jgi:hypothetical protein
MCHSGNNAITFTELAVPCDEILVSPTFSPGAWALYNDWLRRSPVEEVDRACRHHRGEETPIGSLHVL